MTAVFAMCQALCLALQIQSGTKQMWCLPSRSLSLVKNHIDKFITIDYHGGKTHGTVRIGYQVLGVRNYFPEEVSVSWDLKDGRELSLKSGLHSRSKSVTGRTWYLRCIEPKPLCMEVQEWQWRRVPKTVATISWELIWHKLDQGLQM